MTLIDLYHIESRHMWYNEVTGELIQGEAAFRIGNKSNKLVGFRYFEDAKTIKIGSFSIKAYGKIYKI